jgi:hypothetical protein
MAEDVGVKTASAEPATDEWVPFRLSDPSVVVDMVRAVAETAEPGEHGHGVEIVIEAPRLGFWGRLLRDRTPDQARLAVTKPGGEVAYPFSVQLVSGRRARRAVRRVGHRKGWATSNSAGLAFIVQKGPPWVAAPNGSDEYAWAELVNGSLAALCDLTAKLPDKGWRVTIDRAVKRS